MSEPEVYHLVWSASLVIEDWLFPFSICLHSNSAQSQLWLLFVSRCSDLSGKNSFFSKMLSEQVNPVWLRCMKGSSYKRRDRCFSCNPLVWLPASLEPVLQNQHTHQCRSSRLSVATRVLIQLWYLGGQCAVNTVFGYLILPLIVSWRSLTCLSYKWRAAFLMPVMLGILTQTSL